MTTLTGTTPVSAPISPGKDDRNTWPTHLAKWGQGGLKLVKTIQARDAIEDDRRFESVVFVESGVNGEPQLFYWNGSKEDGTDGQWVEWDPTVDMTAVTKQIQALQEGQRVLQSNINMKPDGLSISDEAGTSLSDIAKIVFGDGVLVDDIAGEPDKVRITFGAELPVSNGQESDSKTIKAKALEFPGASLTLRDPTGAKVGIVEFADKAASLVVDDGTTNVGGVATINTENMDLSDEGGGSVRLSPYISVSNIGGDYYSQRTKAIDVHWPLKFEASKSSPTDVNQDRTMLTMDHASFEPVHKPGFLAYTKGSITVNGGSVPVSKDVHEAGMIAFEDDVFANDTTFIRMANDNSTFTIQEADEKDPNVSGGTDYLVSFRISMDGYAPSDGTVLLYLYDSSMSPYDTDMYLEDKAGNPLVAIKHYSKGSKLGYADITGIVNAKGMKSFTCHVVTDFKSGIKLGDRFNGGTGLVVQSITPSVKTSEALIQFELDTDNKLWFEYDEKGGYKLRESQNYGSVRGEFSEKYEAFIQDTHGFVALRYTVNDTELPMPCGIAKKGNADVEVDPSVNQVAGSQAKGGEGAIKFNSDGEVKVSTSVRVSNENSTPSTVSFWWATVDADGNMTKIDESEKTTTVVGKVKNQEILLPTFKQLVESGDRIALRAKADRVDGVFLYTDSDRYPLVETTLDFKEIVQQP